MIKSDLHAYIQSGYKGHLVGIGGVSMSPLAEVLHNMGITVTGSDLNDSDAVLRLRSLGINVMTGGHKAENIAGADFIIRTAAAREDNEEIAAARKAGLPVFERAEAWGYIMRSYENAVCVAGTHGKTTTTSMVTHILMAADRDPTVMIGGTLPKLGSGYQVGDGDVIVLEACEYYNSYHCFFPTVAVILNIDMDHLDFFKSLDDVKASFRKFAALVPENGTIVCNADDKNTMDTLIPLGRDLMTFGLGEKAVVRAANIVKVGRNSSFDVLLNGEFFCHLNINVPGQHNIMDALAATATAIALHIPPEAISDGFTDFTGAGRRFEYKGTLNGACIYDDYAHHPHELKNLLDMVDSLGYRRILLAFQPHTYTRTNALFDDFIKELSRVDHVLLAEIYAAREKNTIGISSSDLTEKLTNAVYCPTFEDMEQKIRQIAGEGDIILTVGAGDIFKVGEKLAEKPQSKQANVV